MELPQGREIAMEGIGQKHPMANELPTAAWEKNNQMKQTTGTPKSLEERQGSEMFWGIKASKSSCICWGISKTMYMPKVGKMFRKKSEKTLSPYLRPTFKLHADRK